MPPVAPSENTSTARPTAKIASVTCFAEKAFLDPLLLCCQVLFDLLAVTIEEELLHLGRELLVAALLVLLAEVWDFTAKFEGLKFSSSSSTRAATAGVQSSASKRQERGIADGLGGETQGTSAAT
eukprot:CAMPEP_0171059976 /NCGR_PEP_ID=MMETSP0766_2-20121228/3536_1 /TAXON_ID=439317 /ORGANISM="Gambierdiscus australes, Strain CAWD 149" /LENGTH=124 /DNA_ID=CAMNT_0011515489 /DNA_START=361 /DNA_END=732 /DNA_ORIENTATION=+